MYLGYVRVGSELVVFELRLFAYAVEITVGNPEKLVLVSREFDES